MLRGSSSEFTDSLRDAFEKNKTFIMKPGTKNEKKIEIKDDIFDKLTRASPSIEGGSPNFSYLGRVFDNCDVIVPEQEEKLVQEYYELLMAGDDNIYEGILESQEKNDSKNYEKHLKSAQEKRAAGMQSFYTKLHNLAESALLDNKGYLKQDILELFLQNPAFKKYYTNSSPLQQNQIEQAILSAYIFRLQSKITEACQAKDQGKFYSTPTAITIQRISITEQAFQKLVVEQRDEQAKILHLLGIYITNKDKNKSKQAMDEIIKQFSQAPDSPFYKREKQIIKDQRKIASALSVIAKKYPYVAMELYKNHKYLPDRTRIIEVLTEMGRSDLGMILLESPHKPPKPASPRSSSPLPDKKMPLEGEPLSPEPRSRASSSESPSSPSIDSSSEPSSPSPVSPPPSPTRKP